MGLSDDQRAMLRLLAQREQGYEDIAALMGISVEEVRARVGDALAQLESEGKETPDVPAPPPPPAPPKVDPPPPTPAPAPAPEPPAPAPTLEPPPAATPPASGGGSRLKLPSDPAVRAAIAAGVLVVALLAIFLIVNGGGGDSDSGTASTTAAETTEDSGQNENAANTGSRALTKAVLEPVDGSEATGVAIFGRVGKKLALQVEAEGLEPTTNATSYTLWLAQSPQRMLPLAETAVPKSGRIGARFEVPVELVAYLATETFDQLVITRTDRAKLKATLAEATKEKATPTYTGTAVLAGTVTGPLVGIAKRAQQQQE
jgi:outer membrane biosynthesis protein TonB